MRVLINLQIQSQLPHRHAQPYTHTRKPAWIHNTHYTCILRTPTQTHWQAHTSELSVGWFQFQSDFTAWPRTRPLADGTLPCMSSGNWELKVMFSVMIHNIMIFIKSSAAPCLDLCWTYPPGILMFPTLDEGIYGSHLLLMMSSVLELPARNFPISSKRSPVVTLEFMVSFYKILHPFQSLESCL